MSGFKKQLNAFQLWAITVGTVISGQFFGWNYALNQVNLFELLAGFLIVGVFYLSFIFCCAELASSVPCAGGPSRFVQKAFGPFWGCLTGFAILMEFGFGVPAIAVAAGSYTHFLLPAISPHFASIFLLVLFIGVNVLGTRSVAIIEMSATVLALIALFIFYHVGLIHVFLNHPVQSFNHATKIQTIFMLLPFLCWIYLGVEGGAMAAEEMTHAHQQMGKGLCLGMLTLLVLSFFTILIVYFLQTPKTSQVDFPLLQVVARFYGQKGWLTLIISFLGLFGLMASLNGLIVCYSRQIFSLSREGFLPPFFSKISKRHVPSYAIVFPGVFAIICCFSADLANALVGLSVCGATLMYCLTLLAHIVLRFKEPHLHRPFKAWFPITPVISLVLGIVCIYAIVANIILKDKLDLFGLSVPLFVVCLFFFTLAFVVYLIWKKSNGFLSFNVDTTS